MKCIINRKLEFSQRVYFLLKKQVTKLYQRPMCFDASTSNSHESILQEEKFQKGNTSIRLVFTGTQYLQKFTLPVMYSVYYQKWLKRSRLKVSFFEKTSKSIS